jgi:hypothetical protein
VFDGFEEFDVRVAGTMIHGVAVGMVRRCCCTEMSSRRSHVRCLRVVGSGPSVQPAVGGGPTIRMS